MVKIGAGINTLILVGLGVLLTGINSCDKRQIQLYEYQLQNCSNATFPSRSFEYNEWKIEPDESDLNCEGFSYHHLIEKYYKPELGSTPKAQTFYLRITQESEKICILKIAMTYPAHRENPRKITDPYVEKIVHALSKILKAKAVFPEKQYSKLGDKTDFSKYCQQ